MRTVPARCRALTDCRLRETISTMRRLIAALLVASVALLGVTASARSQPQTYSGTFGLQIKGWGRVVFKSGLGGGVPLTCSDPFCAVDGLRLRRARIVLLEKSYPYRKGWKFAGWWGACKGKKPKCVIKVARIHPNSSGRGNVHVGAKFVPVAAGLTRAHPIPLGTAASIADTRGDFRLRVNSVLENVQLSPSPPAGSEYFAANVTLSNVTSGPLHAGGLGWQASGSHHTTYTPGNNTTYFPGGCPSGGPQPQLQLTDYILDAGQSATGYVCWTIAANDASTLQLYFGSGTLYAGGTTWSALH